MSKTREDVEKLKADWLKDSCWVLHTTEGFEEFVDELKQFAEEVYAKREAESLEKRRKAVFTQGAFPQIETNYFDGMANGFDSSGGLTKREYFAGLALQGLIGLSGNSDEEDDYQTYAMHAVNLSDALLRELNKSLFKV